jgi:hypothetical protein
LKIVGTPVPQPEKQPPQSVSPRSVNVVNTAISGGGPVKGAAGNWASLAALGIPADGLSAAVVSFVKFFSLPLESGLLSWLRRQAAAYTERGSGAAEVRSAAALPDCREALSFAAAAAVSKGVKLSAAGLERYAASIDPAMEDSAAPDLRRAGGVTAPEQYAGEGRDGGGHNCSGGQDKQNKQNRNGESHNGMEPDTAEPVQDITAAGPFTLKEKILGCAGGNPLLDTMNRLPGTDGRRWLVFPFEFAENGEQYRAALRILLDENASHNQGGRMVLDIIKTDGGTGGGRWLFVLDCAGGNRFRLDVFVRPPRSKRALAALGKKLSALTGIPAERLTVQNGGESFFALAEGADTAAHSVDAEA